jgi:Holliday junction resolvase RusA-like endonuclease
MNFPPLEPPQILLNVIIPGEPNCQQRHRWGRGRIYDPSEGDKKIFHGQLQAACPKLKPNLTARIGVRLKVWTTGKRKTQEDVDNFLKFYMDSMSPPKLPRARKGHPWDLSRFFAVWGNDNQVDEVYVRVWRVTLQPKVEILVYVLPSEDSVVK